MAMLVDLSIPAASINTTGPAAAGLQACRTTRLHWLQTNLTQLANGSFVSTFPAVAPYAGPMPGLNDIPHTYTFFLFNQPANFSLPAWDAGRNYSATGSTARMNFSVPAIQAVAGNPVAGNYIRVQNPNNTATGTFVNGTCLNTVTGAGTNATNATSTTGSGSGSSTASASSHASGSGTAAASASRSGSASGSAATSTSAAAVGKVENGVNAALAVVGLAAFAML